MRIFDHGIRQEAPAQLFYLTPSLGFVVGFDGEPDGLAGAHPAYLGKAERGKGALDGRPFGIGDAGPQGHLDQDGELHAVAPGQSANQAPVRRS